ncbi:maleylpyruvate isomerase family mycothiol-dependent enzyme [Leucobacter sp. W1153]|uniref:maleylpyruvate isomerase family mycothiol-dependent enzyme n=1 Tax=Leucobacter sp. W1153 TaxID=3439064 RepID=UPI003F31211C
MDALTVNENGAIDALEAAIARFTGLLSQTSGEEEVPTCPGWNVRDLVIHLGTIHRWAAAIVLSGQMARKPRPVVHGGLSGWYSGTGTALVAALRAVEPNEPVPNFDTIDETAAFWIRRQLHEVIVHTCDLARACAKAEPELPAELAADGIEEVLTVFFRRLVSNGSPPDVRENIRITARDIGSTWVVGPGETPELLTTGAAADATIEGTAQDLYFALWGRTPIDRLHIQGEAARALLEGPTSL